MKNPITTLHIQNFKTIKDLKVKPKRINIIIGKPNVGKSNFLEALSILGADSYATSSNKLFSDYIRYKKVEDLFYDKKTDTPVLVESNLGVIGIKYFQGVDTFSLLMTPTIQEFKNVKFEHDRLGEIYQKSSGSNNKADAHKAPFFLQGYITSKGEISNYGYPQWHSPVKRYEFKKEIPYNSLRGSNFLIPPYGRNLYSIVNDSKDKRNSIFKEIASFFKEYKLEFVIRPSTTTFEVQKKISGIVYSNEYELIADTLQRMIFNIAAIVSNKDSVLLFEEPEAHSFPPYIKLFAEKVIESRSNQFFITTHSPFILNTIIENTPLDEVGVFIASYDKFQTKMTELTKAELEEMLNYGNDIFFSSKLR